MQLAVEAGAKRILIPSDKKRDVAEVPDAILTATTFRNHGVAFRNQVAPRVRSVEGHFARERLTAFGATRCSATTGRAFCGTRWGLVLTGSNRWQGATREHIGHIRPRSNAVDAGCIAARMQRCSRHGLPEFTIRSQPLDLPLVRDGTTAVLA